MDCSARRLLAIAALFNRKNRQAAKFKGDGEKLIFIKIATGQTEPVRVGRHTLRKKAPLQPTG